jgi:hypothetical protein
MNIILLDEFFSNNSGFFVYKIIKDEDILKEAWG